MRFKRQEQMSESYLTAALIVLSGGFQDAYTYFGRGEVYANAQTGNVVQLGAQIISRQWAGAVWYLIPLISYFLGIVASEAVHSRREQPSPQFHWRQMVVLFETLALFSVGFMPERLNILANALVSFSCAMQVQAFRTVHGYFYASTMCIGNLRSGTEALYGYLHTKNKAQLKKAGTYFSVIAIFCVGAALGSLATAQWGLRAIWGSCLLLSGSFCIMFLRSV